MNNDETMSVKRENLLNAYKNANDEQKSFLENLFGMDTFKPKDIRDRIKTFEDACHELGDEHPYVKSYKDFVCDSPNFEEEADIAAYLKLRIIADALNEGWKPQFMPNEKRWAPYFLLFTQEEIDEMDEEIKARVVSQADDSADTFVGVSYAYSDRDCPNVHASTGSRLAFKSQELSEYAGGQFIDIFADFMLGRELKK